MLNLALFLYVDSDSFITEYIALQRLCHHNLGRFNKDFILDCCPFYIQGSHRSWKTWKVLEFYSDHFQAWKTWKNAYILTMVLENLEKHLFFATVHFWMTVVFKSSMLCHSQ